MLSHSADKHLRKNKGSEINTLTWDKNVTKYSQRGDFSRKIGAMMKNFTSCVAVHPLAFYGRGRGVWSQAAHL